MTGVRWEVEHVDPGRARRRIWRRIWWDDVAWSGTWIAVLVLYLVWILAMVWWGGV